MSYSIQATINEFTDMTHAEKQSRLGLSLPESFKGRVLNWEQCDADDETCMFGYDDPDAHIHKGRALLAPAAIPNWSTALPPAREQGNCGGCW
jgi:hypothetical protein